MKREERKKKVTNRFIYRFSWLSEWKSLTEREKKNEPEQTLRKIESARVTYMVMKKTRKTETNERKEYQSIGNIPDDNIIERLWFLCNKHITSQPRRMRKK